jgi:Na+:H+ antiporter, NhaA family
MKTFFLKGLFQDFFQSESSGGKLLLLCTAVSLGITNYTAFGDVYTSFFECHIGSLSISHWINEGLMTFFFLLIGLELEREIYIGELSDLKKASMPIIGAIGGMIIPVVIYFKINQHTPYISGSCIPMATDIAFSLAVLSLFGNRISTSVKIFLTALAVIDDLGAIVMIALFYAQSIQWMYLGGVLMIVFILVFVNKKDIFHPSIYLIFGIAMWYCMLKSGIHASITGVVIAFLLPFESAKETALSLRTQSFLHLPVAFIVLPLFVLCNTAIVFPSDILSNLNSTISIGIIAGLSIGKPLGIFAFTYFSQKIGIASLPTDMCWSEIVGIGILSGIGFTMSIFISLLAFDDVQFVNTAKIAILIASTISGVLGYVYFRLKG